MSDRTNIIIIRKISVALLLAIINFSAQAQQANGFKPIVVYKSVSLIITQISPNAFQHTSYLQTNDFGKVPCNGLVVRSKGQAIVFDTPSDDATSEELIKSITEKLKCKIIAVIPTHFHNDCLGGLKAFHDHQVPSYANSKTIELAKENNFVVPRQGFQDSLNLPVGNINIAAKFFGEGHTRDNVVGYFPAEQILFGGCLVKELDASKGFLGDANVGSWPATVDKVRAAYPDARLIIPGHGKRGGRQLLDYTIRLFRGE